MNLDVQRQEKLDASGRESRPTLSPSFVLFDPLVDGLMPTCIAGGSLQSTDSHTNILQKVPHKHTQK